MVRFVQVSWLLPCTIIVKEAIGLCGNTYNITCTIITGQISNTLIVECEYRLHSPPSNIRKTTWQPWVYRVSEGLSASL